MSEAEKVEAALNYFKNNNAISTPILHGKVLVDEIQRLQSELAVSNQNSK